MLYFPSLFEKHITHKTKTGICGIFLKYMSKKGLWKSGVCFAVSFLCRQYASFSPKTEIISLKWQL